MKPVQIDIATIAAQLGLEKDVVESIRNRSYKMGDAKGAVETNEAEGLGRLGAVPVALGVLRSCADFETKPV